jgi:hypothetical protein
MTADGGAATTHRRLYVWGARCLYMGAALELSSHRNALAVLCAGLDASFEAATGPVEPEGGYQTRRTRLNALLRGEGCPEFNAGKREGGVPPPNRAC